MLSCCYFFLVAYYLESNSRWNWFVTSMLVFDLVAVGDSYLQGNEARGLSFGLTIN